MPSTYRTVCPTTNECAYLIKRLSPDEDLLPFHWCCVESPLCHLYLNKRPLDRCQGYSWAVRDGYTPAKKATQGVGEGLL